MEQQLASDTGSISDFETAFPWCKGHQVHPSAEHVDLAKKILLGIQEIFGENISDVKFLRLVTLKGELQCYIDGDMGDCYKGSRRAAALDMMDECKREHKEALGTTGTSDTMTMESCLSPLEELVLKTQESQTALAPIIEVIPESSMQVLGNLIRSAGCDSEKRLKGLRARLKLVHARKPLATVPDDNASLSILSSQFPNFAELFDLLCAQFALAALGNKAFRLPPILLIGEPGIGKTEVLLRAASMLKTGFLVHNMGAEQNGASLVGSDIHWSNAEHGKLFELLAFGNTGNPIVMLDELDKVSAREYSPLGPLYGLLERGTAKAFCDLSLPGVITDASHVVWFAAANDERDINPAILSRFKVLHIPSPTKDQMPAIARSIYSDLRGRESWGGAFDPDLSDDVIDALEGSPPRDVRMLIEAAVGRAAIDGRRAITANDLIRTRRQKVFGFQ